MVVVNSEVAICILNAFKQLSTDTRVLNGLNMCVPSGCIYGLLGPSGCGKTTLINIILGKLPLDSGFIKINANNISDIGYMPQDLCLDTMLTIHETFQYYGSLHNMNEFDIFSRSKELIAWLKLPPCYTLLKYLSGGQCRRVSLAVTLLHNPKIIILDEPTVGIDPVLRHEIWQKLLKIVKEQSKTIIITTHYIEEAHQAHIIGLMRNGVLIEEASPQDILVKQNTTSLEEAFLAISCNQKFNKTNQRANQIQNRKVTYTKLHTKNGTSFIRIRAFIQKNISICVRDFMFIFFMILFPMLAAIIFNVAIGGNIKNVNIAIQNKEIADCKDYKMNGCFYEHVNNITLSCEVLNGLRALEYNLIEVNNHKEGDILVEKTITVAFVEFSQNFSIGLQQRILSSSTSDNYLTNSILYANIDTGNFLVKSQFIRNLFSVIENVIINSTHFCNDKFIRRSFPLKTTSIVGEKVETFIHSIATMFVSMIGFYFSSIISTGFMLTEKIEGFLDRSMTAGITILEVVISILFIQTVIHFIQTISVMFITYFVFNNPVEITNGSFAFVFIIFLNGWLGLLFGLLIVGISSSSSEAMNMVIGWNMLQMYLSGIMWPVEAQIPFMKLVSEHLPLCYTSRLLNNIVLKGWTFGHPTIFIGILVIIGYVILHVIMLLLLTYVKKDAWLVKKL
ncbi:ABC transporter-like,P-loop containing nucleoside triphosphate hydrolase,AAA+ ATPase domain,ABC [Cinara cedri]|uniref:ABC transporter-like,P-loop containing nucleoside triphosphate hydrolase,AAA+ ATPase domain,ABC n=1 Tax=Cinara cedri TaxID=506608 RepID=A0A5E4NJH0_9HEMI|nr:ABC transporter-like,P-loop containing nucleoside triphosphate hydrolase,AAA+ ATPase domain,ABC [Cinara cedri]